MLVEMKTFIDRRVQQVEDIVKCLSIDKAFIL